MKRREFVASVIAGGMAVPAFGDQGGHGRGHATIKGPLANAVVSFGAWQSSPPFDRLTDTGSPLGPNDRTRNVHQLMPHEAKIKVNGFVSFIISGFHNVQIFAPGTTIEELKSTNPLPVLPIGPGIIDIATNRVYRGLNPATQGTPPGSVQDRVESVQLTMPGRYLVICGVLPHFNDNMFGFVLVVRGDDD
jgi:hypothetical protein